jgi:NADH-quinone oxidoreductase subunit H
MKKLFVLSAVTLSVIPAAAIALIPFARNFAILPVKGYSLPLFLAIMTLYPVFVILMGWTANNKFTIIGAFRSIYLDVAGEIPLILSTIGVMIWAGSYDIQEIIESQRSVWFVFPQILGFIVFLVSYMAMIEKVPFDIPEAESELVFGYKTEFSGALLLDSMLGDYVNLLAWTLLMISLYFGGYLGPAITGNLLIDGSIWTIVKLLIAVTIAFTLMITYARLRIDQAIRVGWNHLIPLALLNIILTVFVKYIILGGG